MDGNQINRNKKEDDLEKAKVEKEKREKMEYQKVEKERWVEAAKGLGFIAVVGASFRALGELGTWQNSALGFFSSFFSFSSFSSSFYK